MLVVSRGISELNATWIINNDADLSRITWHDIRVSISCQPSLLAHLQQTTVHPKAIHKILKTNKELSDPVRRSIFQKISFFHFLICSNVQLKDGDGKMWEAVQHEDESKLRMILMMKAMEGASDMLVRADVVCHVRYRRLAAVSDGVAASRRGAWRPIRWTRRHRRCWRS